MQKMINKQNFENLDSNRNNLVDDFYSYQSNAASDTYEPEKIQAKKYDVVQKIVHTSHGIEIEEKKVKVLDPNRLVDPKLKGTFDEWLDHENAKINLKYIDYKNIESLEYGTTDKVLDNEIREEMDLENSQDDLINNEDNEDNDDNNEDDNEVEEDLAEKREEKRDLKIDEFKAKRQECLNQKIALLAAARKINTNRSIGSRLFNWYRNSKNRSAINRLENSIKDYLKSTNSSIKFEDVSVMADYINQPGNNKYVNFNKIKNRDLGRNMDARISLYVNAQKRDSLIDKVSKHLFWTDAYKRAHNIENLKKSIISEEKISKNELNQIYDNSKLKRDGTIVEKKNHDQEVLINDNDSIQINNEVKRTSMTEKLEEKFNPMNDINIKIDKEVSKEHKVNLDKTIDKEEKKLDI